MSFFEGHGFLLSSTLHIIIICNMFVLRIGVSLYETHPFKQY